MLFPIAKRIAQIVVLTSVIATLFFAHPVRTEAYSAYSLQANISGVINTLSLKVYCGITGLFAKSCGVDLATSTAPEIPAVQTSEVRVVTDEQPAVPQRVTGAEMRGRVVETIIERVVTPIGFSGISQAYLDQRLAQLATELRNDMAVRTVTVRTTSRSDFDVSSKQVDSIYEDMNENIDEAIAGLDDLSEAEVISLISTYGATTSLASFDTDDLAEGSTNLYSQWSDVPGGISYTGDVTATTFYGDGSNLTGITSFSTSTTRSVFSSTATGLDYSTSTGIFSLASGYTIPLTASTTEWASKVSSQWTTSGSNIYYNTGSVGIGTSSPQTKLHVYSTTNADGLIVDGTTFPAIQLRANNVVKGYAPVLVTSNGGFLLDSQVDDMVFRSQSNRLLFGVGSASSTMAVSSTGVNINGSVGVGTTTPAANLHVHSTSVLGTTIRTSFSDPTSYGEWHAYEGSTYKGGITAIGSNYTTALWRDSLLLTAATNNTGSFIFRTRTSNSYAERMIITNAGNVGIGTTTPSAKLDLWGNLVVGTSSTPALSVNTANGYVGINTSAQYAPLYVYSTQEKTALFHRNTTANLQSVGINLSVLTGTSNLYQKAGIFLQRDDSLAGGWGVGKLIFAVNGTADSSNASVSDARMTLLPNGNVGIGTTTPTAKLDLYAGDLYFGSSTYNTTVKIADVTAGNTLTGGSLTISAGSATLGSNMSGGNLILQAGNSRTGASHASGDLRLYAGANNFSSGGIFGDIEFYTGALNGTHTQAMTLSGTSGYLGIGTTTPSAKLAVTGTAGTGDVFALASSTNARLLTVTSAGKLGIGTTPTALLDLLSTTEQARFGYDASNYMTLTVAADGESIFDSVGTDAEFSFSDNVGINTTNPATELDIYGSNGGAGNVFLTRNDSTTVTDDELGGIAWGSTDGPSPNAAAINVYATENFSASAAGTYMAFRTTPTGTDVIAEQMRLTDAGYLGIGTTTPARRLHVYTSADEPPVRFQDASGYCEIDPTSTSWSCTSDERLKDNITDLDSGDILSRMSELRPVNFTWKNGDGDTVRTGLIAQEVERIFPELVNTDENGYKSVSYGGFTVYFISAIKQLTERFEKIAAWFGDNRFTVIGDICVDDVCLSKEEFKNLLRNGANVHDSVDDDGDDSAPAPTEPAPSDGGGDGTGSADGSTGTPPGTDGTTDPGTGPTGDTSGTGGGSSAGTDSSGGSPTDGDSSGQASGDDSSDDASGDANGGNSTGGNSTGSSSDTSTGSGDSAAGGTSGGQSGGGDSDGNASSGGDSSGSDSGSGTSGGGDSGSSSGSDGGSAGV